MHGLPVSLLGSDSWSGRVDAIARRLVPQAEAILKAKGYARFEAHLAPEGFGDSLEDPDNKQTSVHELYRRAEREGFAVAVASPIEFMAENTDSMFSHSALMFDGFPGYRSYNRAHRSGPGDQYLATLSVRHGRFTPAGFYQFLHMAATMRSVWRKTHSIRLAKSGRHWHVTRSSARNGTGIGPTEVDEMEYDYVPISQRAPLHWPNGARVALILTFNFETWDLTKETDKPYYAGGPPILPDVLPGNVPDFPNYSWRDYGCNFYCDIMNDDQPYLLRTPHGPIVSTPYSNEINDFTFITRKNFTTDQFRNALIEELDVLYAEGAKSGRIMNVGIHPHVSGRAHRIRALREFIQHAQSLPGVWWATREEIADWYLANHASHFPGQG